MKKLLPYLISFTLCLIIFSSTGLAFAQTVGTTTTPSDGTWVNDTDVTFVGKVGARSGQFLDWTLQNYKWEKNIGSGEVSPISTFWAQIRNIVYAFFTLFVLITAFALIITRGRSITIKKFIPRFILIVFLVTFSFALVQFIYQIGDVIQGFFFSVPCLKGETVGCGPSVLISQKNLLNIGFNYTDFIGYRRFGATYDESAFISLLLIKLTAATYYVMAGVLLVRKIILWFFIIISPIFPLLLLYAPIRNTGKIWLGEFFRWLLYAPLFAILLQGLVYVWKVGIPLLFTTSTQKIVYPTAINILLGGPGQTLSLENSVNNQNTFALYVVALLMLWVIIILPFLLLQIFLDYLNNYSFSENPYIAQLLSSGSGLLGKNGQSPVSPAPLPSSHQPAGMARSLPFAQKISIPEVNTEGVMNQLSNLKSSQTQVMSLTNLSLPTMKDIAKFETASLTKDIGRHEEMAKYHESLEKIGNPRTIASAVERQKYLSIKDKLIQESQQGNQAASSILAAASTVTKTGIIDKEQESLKLVSTLSQIANPQTAPAETKQKLQAVKEQLEKAKVQGDPLATTLLDAMSKGKDGVNEDLKDKIKEAKERGNSVASLIMQEAGLLEIKEPSGAFPAVNRVQQVSIDDYESVKKMWVENYQNLDVPKQQSRKEWVSTDVEKINQAINYLVSADPQNVKKGMESVGNILPFLLIGGFSQTEVIAYLKAKLEAAKTVLADLGKKDEEEETMLDSTKKKEDKPKEMTAEAKIDDKLGEENE